MASMMKSMGGGVEKMKKLAVLAKDFSGNVTDLVEKCGKVSTSLVSLVTTVSDMMVAQTGDASTLKASVSDFSESISDLKKEIDQDLTGNLNEAKEIVGDDNKGKPGKPEEMVTRITTVIQAALKLTETFLVCVEDLLQIISAVEENRWTEAVEILKNVKGHVEEVKENIDAIKEAIKGDSGDSKDKEGKDKNGNKSAAKENKKEDKTSKKATATSMEKATDKKDEDDSESCFTRVFCCCCRKK